MDLVERKNRLKTVLELESDKDLINDLKKWYPELNGIYQEVGGVGDDEAKRLIMKHFPEVVKEESRRKRLTFVLNLLMGFEDTVVIEDGVSREESGKIVQEVLNSIE